MDGHPSASQQCFRRCNASVSKGPVVVSVDGGPWGSYESGVFNGCRRLDGYIRMWQTPLNYEQLPSQY